MKTLHLYTDGGARNNPGPAGTGIVIKTENGEILCKKGFYIGKKTNNEAEYIAVIQGIQEIKKFDPEKVSCHVDSQLVANQLNGIYKIKQTNLQELAIKVFTEARKLKRVEFKYLPRNKNKEADKEVNKAIDEALGN